MKKNNNKSAVAIAVVALACGPGSVQLQAAEPKLDLAARAGISYSDNVGRAATDEISSAAAVLGLDVGGHRPEGRFRYDITGEVEYVDYFTDFAAETVGGYRAAGVYDVIPDVFSWDLGSSMGQIRGDLRRPDAPDNRETVTTLATGPTLRLGVGSFLEEDFEAHYAIARYNRRDFDNDTRGAQVTVGHRPSARAFIGAGVNYDSVTFISRLGLGSIDFKRREAYLRYQRTGARTVVSADAGYAQISGGELDRTGPLVRLAVSRRLTPSILARASYSEEFPTSEASIKDAADQSILTAGPRLNRIGSVGLTVAKARTQADLDYVRGREEGELLNVGERTTQEIRARLTRLMTPRARASVFAARTLENVAPAGFEVRENTIGGEVMFTLGKSLALEFHVEHRKRESDLATNRYHELAGILYLRYGRVAAMAQGVPGVAGGQ